MTFLNFFQICLALGRGPWPCARLLQVRVLSDVEAVPDPTEERVQQLRRIGLQVAGQDLGRVPGNVSTQESQRLDSMLRH